MCDVILSSPDESAVLLKSYSKKRIEHFGIVCLDSERRVIGKKVLFIGDEKKARISVKNIFWEACKKKAVAIIVFHNHSSGNVQPSEPDIETTSIIGKACEIMGIQLLDHVIVGKRGNYFSFLEHGLLKYLNEKDLKAAEIDSRSAE